MNHLGQNFPLGEFHNYARDDHHHPHYYCGNEDSKNSFQNNTNAKFDIFSHTLFTTLEIRAFYPGEGKTQSLATKALSILDIRHIFLNNS